jgi:hypothetical protein
MGTVASAGTGAAQLQAIRERVERLAAERKQAGWPAEKWETDREYLLDRIVELERALAEALARLDERAGFAWDSAKANQPTSPRRQYWLGKGSAYNEARRLLRAALGQRGEGGDR